MGAIFETAHSRVRGIVFENGLLNHLDLVNFHHCLCCFGSGFSDISKILYYYFFDIVILMCL